MPVIEVDLLLAYLVSEDRHHAVASRYFLKVMSGELEKPGVAPLALQELELGVRAGKILPHGKVIKGEADVATFMRENLRSSRAL